MDDLNGFVEFFGSMGHKVTIRRKDPMYYTEDGPEIIQTDSDQNKTRVPMFRKGDRADLFGDEPPESMYQIGIAQAWFCFDKDKNYLGAIADEIGYFTPRQKDN